MYLPVAVDFDKLGLTDNENPYGVLPPVLARSMGRMSGILLADYIGQVLRQRRFSRAAPPPPQPLFGNFHGGERYDRIFIFSYSSAVAECFTVRSVRIQAQYCCTNWQIRSNRVLQLHFESTCMYSRSQKSRVASQLHDQCFPECMSVWHPNTVQLRWLKHPLDQWRRQPVKTPPPPHNY